MKNREQRKRIKKIPNPNPNLNPKEKIKNRPNLKKNQNASNNDMLM